MKLSKESQYGLRGLAYLAVQSPGTILQINQVAKGASLPQAFLAKIFRKLANHGILRSYKGGKDRGYSLIKPAKEVSLKEIVEAIEGPDVFQRCVFWSDKCSDTHPCMLHEIWRSLRPLVSDRMARVSLLDLIRTQDTQEASSVRSVAKTRSARRSLK